MQSCLSAASEQHRVIVIGGLIVGENMAERLLRKTFVF